MKVSIIISAYNEANTIVACLTSLANQTKKDLEIIVVDDGSTDNTKYKIKNSEINIKNLYLLEQDHKGPGAARNLGVKKAKGEIVVFVDADMTFSKDFIANLVEPIEQGMTKGTFTKEELVANWENVWARCWNYNKGIGENRSLPRDYPDKAPVFRGILKTEFDRVGGFTEDVGWTDDWTVSQKLGYQASATHAVCYHANPASLSEVFRQARWIGKSAIISGSLMRVVLNALRYSWLSSLIIGLWRAIQFRKPQFILFKFAYDTGIQNGILLRMMANDKNK